MPYRELTEALDLLGYSFMAHLTSGPANTAPCFSLITFSHLMFLKLRYPCNDLMGTVHTCEILRGDEMQVVNLQTAWENCCASQGSTQGSSNSGKRNYIFLKEGDFTNTLMQQNRTEAKSCGDTTELLRFPGSWFVFRKEPCDYFQYV